jgi:hypothetical protein
MSEIVDDALLAKVRAEREQATGALEFPQIAALTGRTAHACENKANRLGIVRGSGRHVTDGPWTALEDTLLADLRLGYQDVADRTGRSYKAVEYRAKLLGIERKPDYRDWEPAEILLLADLSLGLAEVARRTGRSRKAVEIKAIKLGIVRRKQPKFMGGANDYRGRGWAKRRLLILERDGYICQDCQTTDFSGRILHVHHKIPWRLWRTNDPEWLVTLCNSCHPRRPEHDWLEIPEEVLVRLAA